MKDKTDCGPEPKKALPTCKGCGKPLDRVIVESKCTQVLTTETNEFHDTEVGETLAGYCRNCGKKIPPRILKTLEDWAIDRICA